MRDLSSERKVLIHIKCLATEHRRVADGAARACAHGGTRDTARSPPHACRLVAVSARHHPAITPKAFHDLGGGYIRMVERKRLE
jgi:hypothetical protein